MDTKKTLDCKQYIKLEYTINVGTQSWLSCVKYINPLTKEIIVTYSMHSVQEDLDMSFFFYQIVRQTLNTKRLFVLLFKTEIENWWSNWFTALALAWRKMVLPEIL